MSEQYLDFSLKLLCCFLSQFGMAEDAPKPKQLWGDVEDDPPSSSSTPAVDLPVESLTIHDEAKEAESLDEPKDSSIQAVRPPYDYFSCFI